MITETLIFLVFVIMILELVVIFGFQREIYRTKEEVDNDFFEKYELQSLFKNNTVTIAKEEIDVYVVDSPFLNTSVSKDLNGYFLIVSDGFCNATPQIRKGIFAHELGHIEKETQRTIPKNLLFALGLTVTLLVFTSSLFLNSIIGLFISNILLYLVLLVMAKNSREEEYYSDSFAKQILSLETTRKSLERLAEEEELVTNSSSKKNTKLQSFNKIFFGSWIAKYINSPLDTHPPIEKRIKRL